MCSNASWTGSICHTHQHYHCQWLPNIEWSNSRRWTWGRDGWLWRERLSEYDGFKAKVEKSTTGFTHLKSVIHSHWFHSVLKINSSLECTDPVTLLLIILLLLLPRPLSLPCAMVLLEVRRFQPDAFLAWKHRQRMCIDRTCALVRSMNSTLHTQTHAYHHHHHHDHHQIVQKSNWPDIRTILYIE